jgi:hypothetical protein
MTFLAVLPLLAALIIAMAVTAFHRRVRPRVAAVLLSLAICGVALAVVPTVVVLALGFLVHVPLLGGGFEWCRIVLGIHPAASPWMGAIATVVLAVGTYRVVRSVRAWRRHRCADAGTPAVVADQAWFAYALPGPGRRVALSSGLVDALDTDELEVVLAHERGHVHHRHDRHLLAAELAAALVPPLDLLRRRLRFALERWADEDAVEALGGDRERVARTLARVALGPTALPYGVAAFSGLGVAARVEALLDPQPLSNERIWSTTIGVGVVAVGLAAVVQAHHLAHLILTLCTG